MPDPTNADRQRRYRERQAGRLPPAERPTCPACSIAHTGARGLLCSRCWERLTEEGRQFKRDRVAKARARKRTIPVVYTEAMAAEDDALLEGVVVDTDGP
jgi:hypothetical protein